MSENANKPNTPRKLTDEEMAYVAGGRGYWDSSFEALWVPQHQFELNKGVTKIQNFEEWLVENVFGPDMLIARNAWIADGRPEKVSYYYEDGCITKSDIKS